MVSIARLLLSRSIEWLILNTPLQLINILDSIKAVYYISKSGIKSTLPMQLLNMQLLSSIGHCSGVDTKNPDELKKIDKKVEAKVKGSEFSLQFCEVILLSLPNIEDSFFYCCSIWFLIAIWSLPQYCWITSVRNHRQAESKTWKVQRSWFWTKRFWWIRCSFSLRIRATKSCRYLNHFHWKDRTETDWLTYWLTDWLMYWLTDWYSDWLTDILTDWPIHWLTDWLTDLLTYWLIYWLTDLLTDWLIY